MNPFASELTPAGRDKMLAAQAKRFAAEAKRVGALTVTLQGGRDAEVASQLRTYLADAQDGVRRIAIAGAYCEWIVQQLPHGKLTAWLKTYAPDVGERTVRKWRDFARSLFDAAKRPHGAAITIPQHELLAANVDSLDAEAREARQALDELLAGKTYRQLTFEFKQMEEGADGELRVKRGRMKGCTQTRTSRGAQEAMKADAEAGLQILREATGWANTICTHEGLRLAHESGLPVDQIEAAMERFEIAATEAVKCVRAIRKGLRG